MKVAMLGYGKMGKAIEAVLTEQAKGDEMLLKITGDNLDELTTVNLQSADVAIDFSRPESAYYNILRCFEAGIPIVVGTTAWTDKLPELKQRCENDEGTLFFAPNFSIGVNLFFDINRRLAELMDKQPQYSIRMEETHHTEKLDAPSGTAIKLADDVVSMMDAKTGWSMAGEAKSEEIPITSKREPEVPGTHIVEYLSSVDSIEIKHTAHSRKGFAEGAVAAARWLIGRRGYFEMKDFLNT